MQDQFFVRLLRGTGSLLVWALHFTLCYGVAAAQCTPGGLRTGGPDRVLLGVATVIALGLCVWLGWRARMRVRSPDATLTDWSALAGAVLAAVAIAWNGIPLLLVAGCA